MRRNLAILAAAVLIASLALLARSLLRENEPGASPVFFAGTEAPCVDPAGWMKEYRFKPNCRGIGRAGSRQAEMAFNAAGLRGPDATPAPARDTYRVLVFGASNVLGIGVPEELTMPRKLEAELRRLLKRKVEVINAATNGYCTWQTAFTAREFVRRYRPHLVLHNLGVPSCLIYDWIWEPRIAYAASGEPLGIDRSLARGGPLALLNGWYYRPGVFFTAHTAHEMLRRVVAAWKLLLTAEPDRPALVTASMRKAAAYMQRVSLEEGAFYVAFFHPAREPVINHYLPYVMKVHVARFLALLQPDVFVSHNGIWAALLDSGIPTLFMNRFVYEAGPDDGHLTVPALAEWAKQLAEMLSAAFSFEKAAPRFDQKKVPRPCPGKFQPDRPMGPGRACE